VSPVNPIPYPGHPVYVLKQTPSRLPGNLKINIGYIGKEVGAAQDYLKKGESWIIKI